MSERSLDRLYGRSLVVDLCRVCQGLWFDDLEHLQLTPGATLQLFSALGRDTAAEGGRGRRLTRRLACPRCSARLVETHDLQRTTRFSFFRCPRGHGRYLTFYQFLRARNFVRALTAAEIAELRRHVQQVNCANCGAPVDVDRRARCAFCASPIAVLDPDQVRKVVDELQRTEHGRHDVDPALPVRLLTERLRAEREFAAAAGTRVRFDALDASPPGNLVQAGLRIVARWLAMREHS